ncbi:MAG: helix-turn-helix transcriptional regulator [Proteobacteria bacterium]|nr:helix-turn-helix transcriptional regulator [Pseudomonadota bacterium]
MPAEPNDSASSAIALPTQRVLGVAESVWSGRDAIEDYLDRLNRSSQIASRRIHQWDARDDGAMGLSSVLLLPPDQRRIVQTDRALEFDAFMGEFRGSFGVEVIGGDTAASAAVYMVGLPLAGTVTVTTRHGTCTARAGEGVIVDPSEVVSSRLSAGMHFVEFCVPKVELARLAGLGVDGRPERCPRFALHLQEGLARRLLFMAAQAADVLQAPDIGPGTRMMFQRWCEMIALTLLHEQPVEARALPAPRTEPATPGVKRALDYIHAHADGDIGLADIADAAHLSVSSLLRHFQSQLGMSPYNCLKGVRLERARDELLAADAPAAVRDIALRWGFQNAGKFSQTYRLRFGELPSQTRARRGNTR